MKQLLIVTLITASSLLFTCPCYSAENDTGAASDEVEASPNEGWGETPPIHSESSNPSVGRQILLWVPNRIVDFIDIFRIDLGIGFAGGAVVRVTKYGQIGGRLLMPVSARIGDFGRRAPVMLESSSEFGVGPLYKDSGDRKVCRFEFGAGADLIIGAYGGFCAEELVDFVAGIFFQDTEDDDWQ